MHDPGNSVKRNQRVPQITFANDFNDKECELWDKRGRLIPVNGPGDSEWTRGLLLLLDVCERSAQMRQLAWAHLRDFGRHGCKIVFHLRYSAVLVLITNEALIPTIAVSKTFIFIK